MTTTFLERVLGLKNQEFVDIEIESERLQYHCQTKTEALQCSKCGSKDVIRKGAKSRHFRSLPIGRAKTMINAKIQRLQCYECGAIQQEVIEFADPKRTYTNQLKQYVLYLSTMMTIQDVGRTVGLSWDQVKKIIKEDLGSRFGNPDLTGLKIIAIDEIAIQKGHKYLTVVLNMETGIVVFVGNGKGADSLEPFWERVKEAGCQIEAVSIDMSSAYINAVESNLGKDKIVFDHFHIIKILNEGLSGIRRDIFNSETDELKKKP